MSGDEGIAVPGRSSRNCCATLFPSPGRAGLLTVGRGSFEHGDHFAEPVGPVTPHALDLIKATLSCVSLPETDSHPRAAAL
jgi:hypothetical protein